MKQGICREPSSQYSKMWSTEGRDEILKALHESEEKFRVLTETVSVAIFILQDSRFRYANPATENISEYTGDELLSMDFMTLIHPDMRVEVKKKYNIWAVSFNPEDRYELKGISKSGKAIWVDVRGKTISYMNKPALLLMGIDITERKQAEEALRESEERLRLCAATAHFGTFEWDIVKDTHYWSPETYEIYGIEPNVPLTFEYIKKFIFTEDLDDPTLAAAMDPAGHGDYSMEYRITRASDGAVRRVYLKGQVYFEGDGPERKAVRILGAVQDITMYKQAEEAMQSAKAQAELYLDLMGHDINNMNQIALGYLELARKKSSDRSQQEFMDKSIEVLQRSTNLIKNVRKLQKLQESELRTEIVDVCPVLVDIQREYGAMPEKQITLNFNGVTRCYVRANELLYDIFSNLATNAIKHTKHTAKIVIDLDIVEEDNCRYCRVTVEDDGPGITDELKPKIFNRLLPGTAKSRGMGLGLYLVKSLVENYNGKIWVEDRVPDDPSMGARFVVMLPAIEK